MAPSPGRFPRTVRLCTKAAFEAVFASGRKFSDPHFLVLALQRAGGGARLGMAISRRHARTAVERNRVKRLIREAFRRHRSELPGLDLVVMLRSSPRAVANTELRAALDRLFGLLGERRTDEG